VKAHKNTAVISNVQNALYFFVKAFALKNIFELQTLKVITVFHYVALNINASNGGN
jgi:hypothetical protein